MTQAAYPPIRDYALVGDCHGAALVSRTGCVDWCCLGRFDADPVFCRLLDAEQGGSLEVELAGAIGADRRYLPETNLLQTAISSPAATVLLTDFMPVGRAPEASVHDYVSLNAPHWFVRIIECTRGTAQLCVRYRPTREYGRRRPQLEIDGTIVTTSDGPCLLGDVDFAHHGPQVEARVTLHAGQRKHLVVARRSPGCLALLETVESLKQTTQAFWQEWSTYCRYDGPYRDKVLRSALALKALTYAPTGAIVAAPTTSLPESIGGTRNWDYRYCWPRDAAFTLYSLGALGYSGEARRFGQFLYDSCKATHPRVQVLYGIGQESELPERTLDHLAGYRHSRPVRIGNDAFEQLQLDVYGEVLDWAYLQQSLGGRFDRANREYLLAMAHYVARQWQEPDQGIWEMRGPPQHHTFGKVMSWVALDRAIRVCGDQNHLAAQRERLQREVLRRGIDASEGRLTGVWGKPDIDAALLLVPLLGFDLDSAVLQRTIDCVQRRLQRGLAVYRYDSEDGLPGKEGAFLVCSFWLVDALLAVGRLAEARTLFEGMLNLTNDVGLLAEEIDPDSLEFLGNFPQALTHLSLIQSAVNLNIAESAGPAALWGTHADRARHSVEATTGPRALWAAFKKTGRLGRLISSRASLLR